MPGQIADAVWGDDPPPTWPKQVQICVARLRKVLGAGGHRDRDGRLPARGHRRRGRVDRFERLVERGPRARRHGRARPCCVHVCRRAGAVAGPPFEDLVEWEPGCSEATRLESFAAESRRSCSTPAWRRRPRAVAAAAEPLVAAEPLRERRWAILALAQYRCGRQADALRSIARARRLPRRTARRRSGTRAGRPRDRHPAPGRVARRRPAPRGAPRRRARTRGWRPTRRPTRTGSSDGLPRSSACIDRLRETTLLVVTGPSGCGKSSLLHAGLVPALLRLGQPVVTFVPGSDPDAAMSEAHRRCRRPSDAGDRPVRGAFTLAAVDAGQVFCRARRRDTPRGCAGDHRCARRPPRWTVRGPAARAHSPNGACTSSARSRG